VSHHILVTSLHQRAVPMIRYWINDRIRIAPPTGRYPVFTARVMVVDKIPRSPLGKRLRFVPERPGD
jgi:phenylacetate-coenzyme A ligase PaaK-like adenylate-forming protein